MKKSLQLISLAFLMFLTTSTLQGQEWTQNGTYKISHPGTGLFMTITDAGNLEWGAALPGNDPKQVWTITDHRTPASTGYMEIWADIPGVGYFSMGTTPANIDGKNITLTANPGLPVADDQAANYGYDQFQRRKTSTSAGGNDALFIKVPGESGSRFGVDPSAAGDPVQFDGSTIDKITFTYVGGVPTAIGDAEVSSNDVYPNPSTNGIFKLKESTNWEVYSISGSVIAKGNGQSIDISSAPRGMYIIKFDGLTKKVMF